MENKVKEWKGAKKGKKNTRNLYIKGRRLRRYGKCNGRKQYRGKRAKS